MWGTEEVGATRTWCVMNVEVCGESWQILGCLVGGRVEGYCGGKYGEWRCVWTTRGVRGNVEGYLGSGRAMKV